ncbi:MAG: ArsA family ATPase [Thermoplasmata archaeon]
MDDGSRGRIRVIIYTGKGGVGKTSVAAATALRAAKMGHKTVVMSTDSAHSLSDSLGIPLSGEIKTIQKNLDAIEIEVQYEIESKWAEIHNYIADFLESQGIEPVTAKELAVLPGMEFMSALFYIEQFYKEEKYDTIIVDTAPTADTIRLLSYPDVIDWYFDKLFGILKNLMKVARATVGHVMRTPLPTDKVLEDVQWMKTRLETVKNIMTDPEQTSVRLVLNPEKMVITETMRAYTYLSLYGYTVECIIVNRVFPESSGKGYFKEKLEEQKRYMKEIDEAFSPLKMMTAQILSKEIVGRESLNLLADMIFGDEDPTQVYSREKPMKMFDEDGARVLALKIPFTVDKTVELYNRKDLLIVSIGSYKRSITLPYTYASLAVRNAKMDDGWLKIYFEEEKEHEQESDRKERRRGGKGVRRAH